MNPEPIMHTICGSNLGPSLKARQAANRLSDLQPLEAIESLMETLARAEIVMSDKAAQRQTTKNIVDRLREQNKRRRKKRGA